MGSVPGGASPCWPGGSSSATTGSCVFRKALALGRELPTPPPDAPTPFSLADPDRVRARLSAAGYRDVDLQPVDEPVEAGDDADHAYAFFSTVGIVNGLLHDLDDAQRAEGLENLRTAFKEAETADGVLLGSSSLADHRHPHVTTGLAPWHTEPSRREGGQDMGDAWIIDSCRTPRGIGKVGKGALAAFHPQRLGATVLAAIAERNDLDTADVDDVVFGTSMQVGTQGGDLGRMAALDAGYATTASGVTLDRFCGSGITASTFAATSIMAGMEDVVIAGGAEMMSSYAANTAGLSRSPFMDGGNLHLRAQHPQTNQGVAADAIATIEGIPRTALDELAAESQRRAEVAIKEGRFDRSLVPVLDEDGTVALDREEYPRPGTTAESLGRAAAVVREARRLPARRGRQHLPPAGAAALPRPRDQPRAPRRQLLRRGRRRGGDPLRQPRRTPRPTA